MNSYFIDISGHQGKVDFQKVKSSGILGVMLKCTEGEDYLSPAFRKNYEGARSAGLVTGAYHFLRGSRPDTVFREGQFFRKMVEGLEMPLGLSLDMESWPETLSAEEAASLVEAFALGAKIPMESLILYSSLDYFRRLLHGKSLSACPRWIANPDHLDFKEPARMIQYSWKGKVDGIGAETDLNLLLPASRPFPMENLAQEPLSFERPLPGGWKLRGKIGDMEVCLHLSPE